MISVPKILRVRIWLFALAVIGALTTGASAAIVTYDFTGVQDGGPGVATGSFSFDTTQPDLNPLPSIGTYSGSFEVSISGGPQDGGFQSSANAEIQIGGGLGFAIFPPSSQQFAHYFQIADISLTNDLPAALDTSVFSQFALLNSALGVPNASGADMQTSYTTTSLVLREAPPAPAPVPLPAGFPLLLAGLGLVGLMKSGARPYKAGIAKISCLTAFIFACTAHSASGEPKQNAPFDWSGAYAGGILGLGFGEYTGVLDGVDSYPDDGAGSLNGEAFGVAVGYNFEAQNVIYGPELRFMKTNNNGGEPCGNPAFSCNFEVDAIAALVGRVGYLQNENLMLYGNAGVAWASTTATTVGPPTTTDDNDAIGFTIGIGAEYALSDQITLRTSANHYDFGDRDYVVSGIPEIATIDAKVTTLEIGLFFHF